MLDAALGEEDDFMPHFAFAFLVLVVVSAELITPGPQVATGIS